MRKCYLCLALLVMHALSGHAQIFTGYRTSNYTGVNGVFFNPANIVDSRYKWDINIVSVDGFVINNQSGLRFKDITKSFNADSLKSRLLTGSGANLKSAAYADVLGPSVMFNLSPKTAIAITTRSRVFAIGNDIDARLARAVIDAGEGNAPSYPISINEPASIVHATGWTEFGASIAQVFTQKGSHHFFKGGLTVKYIAGTADSYLNTNNLVGSVNNGAGGTYLTGTTGSLSINTTAANFNDYKFSDFFKFNGHGVGGDVGFVYEYRPNVDYSKYTDDKWANKYKLKLAVAVTDIGQIKFSKSSNQSGTYNVNIPAAAQFQLNQFKDRPVSDYTSIFNASPYFTNTSSNNNSYTITLPTSLQGNIDYNVNGGFYVNLGGQFALTHVNTRNLFVYNSYSLTPRWENSIWGVSLPINYNDISQFNVGVSFRVGPFFIGSGSVLSAIFHDSKQADLHVGLRFGMPYKKKNRPDTDKDGVYDDVDKCPTVAGLPRYQGCPIPDTDGDGVNDEEDSCKTTAGLPRYHGCPIPDTDKDGVNDEEDSCVNVPGLAQFHGCPDTDGDGIPDQRDKCPNQAGVAQYQGCPVPDTDKDGVPDDQDLCPNDPGPASSKGCPVEKVVVQITADFKNILFDFGKSTIRPESMDILTNAAKTMNEQIPNSNFYIDGYTDNVGSATANRKLSKARAQAVANALIKAGVDKSRVVARGFGKENPKCDNKTEEGRQCNRRVEVVIRNVSQTQERNAVKVPSGHQPNQHRANNK